VTGHQAPPGGLTVISILAGCLFPGQGYDGVLAAAFSLHDRGL
jgi:hypothetical protein